MVQSLVISAMTEVLIKLSRRCKSIFLELDLILKHLILPVDNIELNITFLQLPIHVVKSVTISQLATFDATFTKKCVPRHGISSGSTLSYMVKIHQK